MQSRNDAPKVSMTMRPVDGGRAVIGAVDCPVCGKEHLTVQIRCGDLRVFCGDESPNPDGWSWVSVETIS